MSDPATQPREWRFYVQDMIDFCDKVLRYSAGLDRQGFKADELRCDAVLRNLELIGEAATHVPADIRDAATGVPWRLVIAVRNRLIHGYLGIDDDVVWSIVNDDVPALRLALSTLLDLTPAAPAPGIAPRSHRPSAG
jgi:uncharacterized protein with HEPN domain